jgi:dihydrodipicolinate synthase/N-acetylneuraminate lyase
MLLHERAAAAADDRVPVLFHVGTSTVAESELLAQHAQAAGGDGIVAVTPFFYPVHDGALFDYYQALANAAPEMPLFAYDIPHMAVNRISPGLLKRLESELESFAGLKTSCSDAQIVRGLIDASSPQTLVLAGNERIALGSLSLGADGLISGMATAIPEPFVAMMRAYCNGDMFAARQQQMLVNRILDLVPSGARIGAIKAVLATRGIDVGPPVPPRPGPPEGWNSRVLLEVLHAGNSV